MKGKKSVREKARVGCEMEKWRRKERSGKRIEEGVEQGRKEDSKIIGREREMEREGWRERR